MNLRQFEHFVAVAEEQSFTRAARRVHIAQSALSTSIRRLEEELGGALLYRNPRHVALTPAGEVMLDKARRILADVGAAREAVAGVQGLLSGTLSISAGIVAGTKAYIDLPTVIARFHGEHPGVELRLRQMPFVPALEALRRRDVEIAIMPCPGPIPDGFREILLATDRFEFVCGADHRLARRKTVRPADIAAEPFVVFNREFATRRRADAYFERAGIEGRVSCEVNTVAAVCELVALGVGITILPRRIAEYQSENLGGRGLAVVALSPPGPSFEVCSIVAADRPGNGEPQISAAARTFLAMLEGECSA